MGFTSGPTVFGHTGIFVSLVLIIAYGFTIILYLWALIASEVKFKFEENQDPPFFLKINWTHFTFLRRLLLVMMIFDIFEVVLLVLIFLRVMFSLGEIRRQKILLIGASALLVLI